MTPWGTTMKITINHLIADMRLAPVVSLERGRRDRRCLSQQAQVKITLNLFAMVMEVSGARGFQVLSLNVCVDGANDWSHSSRSADRRRVRPNPLRSCISICARVQFSMHVIHRLVLHLYALNGRMNFNLTSTLCLVTSQ
jgi:hypothetical protein